MLMSLYLSACVSLSLSCTRYGGTAWAHQTVPPQQQNNIGHPASPLYAIFWGQNLKSCPLVQKLMMWPQVNILG
jgi:hypothetical protein